MKKIILLFLMLSTVVFAKWEVGTSYLSDGTSLIIFKTYDTTSFLFESSDNSLWKELCPYMYIGVNVEYSISVVTIEHYQIEKGDNLYLIVIDNEGNEVNCKFYSDDIEDYYIKNTVGRSSVLTKMLYNGKSAKLMKDFETIATFDLRGIKQIMQKHVGSSYWFKYKLND